MLGDSRNVVLEYHSGTNKARVWTDVPTRTFLTRADYNTARHPLSALGGADGRGLLVHGVDTANDFFRGPEDCEDDPETMSALSCQIERALSQMGDVGIASWRLVVRTSRRHLPRIEGMSPLTSRSLGHG